MIKHMKKNSIENQFRYTLIQEKYSWVSWQDEKEFSSEKRKIYGDISAKTLAK